MAPPATARGWGIPKHGAPYCGPRSWFHLLRGQAHPCLDWLQTWGGETHSHVVSIKQEQYQVVQHMFTQLVQQQQQYQVVKHKVEVKHMSRLQVQRQYTRQKYQVEYKEQYQQQHRQKQHCRSTNSSIGRAECRQQQHVQYMPQRALPRVVARTDAETNGMVGGKDKTGVPQRHSNFIHRVGHHRFRYFLCPTGAPPHALNA